MNKYQAYPEYKDSGEEWLGQVPSHWKVIQIKHLSVVKRGASPRPIDDPKYFDDDGEYAWTRIADVTASDVYLNNAPQRLSGLGSSLSVKLEPGALFLSIAGTVGKPCITGIKACIHDGFVYFPELKVPNKFLFYVFAGEQAYKGLGKFGTQLNLNTDTVGGIKIGCASNDELESIIRFLDHETAKIDTLIEKQQQLIQLLKEKRQAVISHAVTKGLNPNAPMRDSGVEWLGEVPEHWVLARLKNVLRIRNGRDYKDVEVEEGGYPVYGSGGIFKRSSSYLYDGKSVLFGRKGTIDKPLVVSGKFWTVDTMFYSEVFDNVLPEYIYYQATFFPFNLLSTNTALPSMTQEDLLMLPFVVPPRIEQEGIIKYVQDKSARFDNLIGKAQSAIELMQERRTALISAAVTGKIDVRHHVSRPSGNDTSEFSA